MGIKVKLIFLAVLLLLSFEDYGQTANNSGETKASNTIINLSVQPLFLLNNAIKLDADIQPTQHRLKYIGGLEFYTGRTNLLYQSRSFLNDETDDKISGFGINLAAKHLIGKAKKANSSYYISPGITYRRLTLTAVGPMFYSYEENGLEYYNYGDAEKSFNLNPLMVYANVGYQATFDNLFFLDLFIGVAQKFVARNEELDLIRNYRFNPYGFNYHGFLIQGGIKLGVKIK